MELRQRRCVVADAEGLHFSSKRFMSMTVKATVTALSIAANTFDYIGQATR